MGLNAGTVIFVSDFHVLAFGVLTTYHRRSTEAPKRIRISKFKMQLPKNFSCIPKFLNSELQAKITVRKSLSSDRGHGGCLLLCSNQVSRLVTYPKPIWQRQNEQRQQKCHVLHCCSQTHLPLSSKTPSTILKSSKSLASGGATGIGST